MPESVMFPNASIWSEPLGVSIAMNTSSSIISPLTVTPFGCPSHTPLSGRGEPGFCVLRFELKGHSLLLLDLDHEERERLHAAMAKAAQEFLASRV